MSRNLSIRTYPHVAVPWRKAKAAVVGQATTTRGHVRTHGVPFEACCFSCVLADTYVQRTFINSRSISIYFYRGRENVYRDAQCTTAANYINLSKA